MGPTGTPTETSASVAGPTETLAAIDSPTEPQTPMTGPTETPTAVVALIETPAEAPAATESPSPALAASGPAPQTMYVCGYERCRDEDEYGTLIFETGIEVWASSDPNDDRILYTVSHDDEVRVVRQERVWEGPGGLWFALDRGGWMSDFWLTAERCTQDNLESYSFGGCLLGEY
jgi:hypothetical protein